MNGFSFGGCVECIDYLLVAILVSALLLAMAVVALLIVRALNMTIFDMDERKVGNIRCECEFEWILLMDDINWCRATRDGGRSENIKTCPDVTQPPSCEDASGSDPAYKAAQPFREFLIGGGGPEELADRGLDPALVGERGGRHRAECQQAERVRPVP